MDKGKYVELEAKYEATSLPVSDFQAAMKELGGTFKTVVGLDTFFSDTEKVLRYRRCRPGDTNSPVDRQALTYKNRRRHGDISDRTEIDLWLGEKATSEDVFAMMEAIGMREVFTITKESWIQHVEGEISGPKLDSAAEVVCRPLACRVDAVFAMYDVFYEGEMRRFLEVEIERVGAVSIEQAGSRLLQWKDWIEAKWPSLGKPLNQSLYEMYAPRNELFVPQSF